MLLVDIFVKVNLPPFPFRLISKPILLLLIVWYYYLNKTSAGSIKNFATLSALLCFLIGDLLIIKHENVVFLALSLLFFSVGKIFFTIKFSHKKDFKVSRLIPFTLLMFVYAILLTGFLYSSLKEFLLPVVISFFLSLVMLQFAYLRKVVFNKKSYFFVLYGVIIYILGEGIMAIKAFRVDIIFQDFLIMFLYGLGLFFIVFGILNETNEDYDLIEKHETEINIF